MRPEDVERLVAETCRRAREAARQLARLESSVKARALEAMAAGLRGGAEDILTANARDVADSEAAGRSAAFVDRLRLDPKRIDGMAQALGEIALLSDPVGSVESAWRRPNGIEISRVRVPIGVIAVIYESRPDVTSDCAALCLKSGNACILRGGSEAARSSGAIAAILLARGIEAGLPRGFLQLVPAQDRGTLTALLRREDLIDLVVPRGGEGLIRHVVETTRIPVIKQYKGVCHVYVHRDANLEMALAICENAKCQRPATCNAMETVLVHREAAPRFLPLLAERLGPLGVTLHGCPETCRLVPAAKLADESTYDVEWLDLELSVKVVDGLEAAADHIAAHGTGHSEAIVTESYGAAERFLRDVDAAAVYVNASTRLTDGGQFGLGAEIGISTQKLHARGPVGVRELTTCKYVIRGSGQLRQ
ncbi:MAG: glutamate-5-semialdehyde dehydrogenase [Candidatus Wallbacteria bacterium]|nr:glutamate-5-semialdehyde dehydrogenase [Candidatus Wallbacteria bacterium]